jgi:hypothetical protein
MSLKDRGSAGADVIRRMAVSVGFWWILGLVLAWAGRGAMNPDGLSYLDIASQAVQIGPSALISTYWSPGYPALISLALLVVRPSPQSEFALTS